MDSNALKNVDSSQQFVMTICLFSKSGRHLCLDSVEERKACCPGGGEGGRGLGGGGMRSWKEKLCEVCLVREGKVVIQKCWAQKNEKNSVDLL